MAETEVTPDPLLAEFLAFAARKGREAQARRWADSPANMAAGRLADAVMNGCKRNAFRAVLKEVVKAPPR